MNMYKELKSITAKRIEQMEDKLKRAPYYKQNRNFGFFMDTLNLNRKLNLIANERLLIMRD